MLFMHFLGEPNRLKQVANQEWNDEEIQLEEANVDMYVQ